MDTALGVVGNAQQAMATTQHGMKLSVLLAVSFTLSTVTVRSKQLLVGGSDDGRTIYHFFAVVSTDSRGRVLGYVIGHTRGYVCGDIRGHVLGYANPRGYVRSFILDNVLGSPLAVLKARGTLVLSLIGT